MSDTEYTYTGGALSGDIILANALAPNQADQLVTPVSFAFGTNYFTNSAWLVNPSGTDSTASFMFSTQNGTITGWTVDISAGTQDAASLIHWGFDSSQNGDTLRYSVVENDCWMHNDPECVSTVQNTAAGIWVDPPLGHVQAPEIGASGAAMSLTFLGCCLLILASKRRGTTVDRKGERHE